MDFGSQEPLRSRQMVEMIRRYLAEEYGLQVSLPSDVLTISVGGYAPISLPLFSPLQVVQRTAPVGDQALPPRRHGRGFRSVVWDGIEYAFTEMQAKAIALLWDAWKSGTPDVPDRDLVSESQTAAVKIADVFKDHEAWGRIIVEGRSKGTHRLAA